MPSSRLIHHLRNYASAGVLSAVVGLVSFPLMTRNLSVADYGIVGLISASITLFVAVGKLGVQHAVIRFFAQIKNSNIAFTSHQLNSTVTVVFLVLATLATSLFLLMGFGVLPDFLQYENISTLFLPASAIVFVRLLGSGFMNFLRAEQRSADVAMAQSLSRFMNLTFLIAVVLLSVLEPHAVVICLLTAEILGVSYAAWQYRKSFFFSRSDVSFKLARIMLVYGLPLMILESLSLVLRLSDRYLIEALLGVDELGQYSASYNLTSYLDIIILAALLQALRPAYMQLWESEGVVKTQDFLSHSFNLYMVLGIPFVAMFALTSPYLLSFLAGPKYGVGAVVIPFVALSFWLEGGMNFLAAGLYIQKDTKALMFCSLAAAILNLSLNVLLIPKYGIIGAAVVTLFCYSLFTLCVAILAFKYLKFNIEWKRPALITILSLSIYLFLRVVEFGSDVNNFLIKGITGSTILALVVWLLVPEVRSWIVSLMKRIGRGTAAT